MANSDENIFCRQCSEKIPKDGRFCPKCGTSIDEKAAMKTQNAQCEVFFEKMYNLGGADDEVLNFLYGSADPSVSKKEYYNILDAARDFEIVKSQFPDKTLLERFRSMIGNAALIAASHYYQASSQIQTEVNNLFKASDDLDKTREWIGKEKLEKLQKWAVQAKRHFWIATKYVSGEELIKARQGFEAAEESLRIALLSCKKSGCFIATACYGSYQSPEVLLLRKFRDNILYRSYWGRAFIRVYYFVSPPLAVAIANNEIARMLTRKIFIGPLVSFVRRNVIRDKNSLHIQMRSSELSAFSNLVSIALKQSDMT